MTGDLFVRRSVIAIVLALASHQSPAQEQFSGVITVQIANVDVIVHDATGKPVVGLTAADFELVEDGKPQSITNFYEVRSSTSADSAPQGTAGTDVVPASDKRRRIAIFVDVASIAPARKAAVLESVRKFIDRMRADDAAMLITWRLGMNIVVPFTSDKERLQRGISTLAGTGAMSNVSSLAQLKSDIAFRLQRVQEGQDSATNAYEVSTTLVERYAAEAMMHQEQMLTAAHGVVSAMTGIEGKKVLLLVTEQLPTKPGADLLQYVDYVFGPYLPRRTSDFNLDRMAGVTGNRMPVKIRDLANYASSSAVAMYSIGTDDAESESSADSNLPADRASAAARVADTASALNVLAEVTGGVAITSTSNFDLALSAIERDLDAYYSLGYRPSESRARQRKIVVRTKNRAYVVRTRRLLSVKSADEQMDDRVIANLYDPAPTTEWKVTVRLGKPQRENRAYVVPVQVTVPATLTLLPQDGRLVGGITYFFAVGTADGHTSTVMRRPKGLKIPPEAEQPIRAKPITYTTAIRVNRGESLLSVGVLDQLAGTVGFTRAAVSVRE